MTPLEALRTPDDRFADLPDFPYPPHYVSDLPGFEGLRVHYLDLAQRMLNVHSCAFMANRHGVTSTAK
jgi:hypothetical protein